MALFRLFKQSMGRWLMMLLLLMLTSLTARAAEAYANYTPSNTTLTFYFDNLRSSRTGTTYNLTASTQTPPGWVNDSTNLSVTKVVFDSSFANYTPASNYRWFYNMSNLTTITNISNLNTQIVISMKEMFLGCSNLTSINLSGFNTANVLNMSYMFEGCSKLTSLDLSGFNTAKVQSMYRMFTGCTGLTSLNLSGFSNVNVTDMESMFHNCSALTNLNLCGFSTPSVTKMTNMFYGCSKLTSLDLSSFNTANVTDMLAMFYGCAKLVSLDLSRFNTANVTRMSDMFYLNVSLASIFVGSDWNTDAVTGSSNMFMRCDKLVGGQGTTYTSAHLDKSYAHIDGGPSNPGYFTDISDVYECFTLGGIFYRVTSESPYEVEVTYKNTNYNSYSGSVTIPSTVTQLGYTFSVTGIGKEAFAYSTGLTSVTIPSSVTSIGNGAFAYCSGLTSVTVPSSVTDMGDAPFGGCDGLTTLKVASGNPVYDSRGNCNAIIRKSDNALISGCKTTVIPNNVTSIESGAFVLLPSLTSIAIPSSVTSIGPIAFGGCTGLTSVTIPSSVTSIGNQAFAQCTGLTSVTCQAEIPPALYDVDVFDAATYANATLTVPPGRVSAYQAANGWKNFAHIDAEPEAYACYTPSNTTLTFYYDNQRSTRTGTNYDLNTGSSYPAWSDQVVYNNVTKVVFDPSFAGARPTSTSHWFKNLFNLTSITGMKEYLNTSEVTNMTEMFFYCRALTSLDVSSFNTAKVTDMNSMFYYCSSLTSFDLSSFNTANVTNMFSMFYYCTGLTSLDLSGFNTANVTNMGYMFNNCRALTNLDVSSFNTANVTAIHSMFNGCFLLGSIDLSSFNTSNVKYMDELFSNCYNLTTIYVGNGWSTSAVTNSSDMFKGCSKLVGGMGTTYSSSHTDATYAHIDGGPSNPGYLTDINAPAEPEAYACYTPSNTTLTFYYDKLRSIREGTTYDLNTGTVRPLWYSICTSVTDVVFNPSFAVARPTTTYSWFRDMSNLTTITGIENLNTSDVAYMDFMFYKCSGLTSLDLSGFNTAKVTSMLTMFYKCSGLTSLDLSNFNTSIVENMSEMFDGCSSLTSLDLSGFNTSNVTTMGYMFQNCSGLTDVDLSHFSTSNVTNMSNMFDGCNNLSSLDLSNFNTSNVTDMSFMFDGCSSLTSLGLSSFNTARVATMKSMFSSCSGLTSLDVSSFNTLNVTTMSSMFYGCSGLTSLDLSNFNTTNVTDISSMFSGCSGLTSLDVSSFNTSNVTIMAGMFDGCQHLTSLDVSSFNTSNVANMGFMFYKCSGLTSLDVSNFNTENVTSMASMFRLSEALTTVYVGDGWSTDAVTTSTNMFQGCTSLVGGKGTTYDSNHVDAAYAHIDGGPSDPGYFTDINAPAEPEAYACYTPSNTTLTFYYDKLRSIREGTIFDINLSGNGMGMLPSWVLGTSSIEEYVKYVVFDPSFANANPTSICGWFGRMENLESITGMTQYLNTSRVTDMTYMFLDCKKLTNLDLSGFNTEKAKYMMGMFSGIGLTELDLSNFNTARVTITNSMFQNCDNLATIYVGEGWSTASVTNSLNMFDGCTSLVGGKGTTYDANHVDAAYAHIDGGPSDPGYFTDINAPAEPEAYAVYTADNTTLTFYYDTERSIREGTTYDMNVGMDDPGWDIDGNYSSVTHVVFDPSFADARPVSTCSWFWGMTNLQSITGMDCMNTEDVTTMWGMFNSCSSLTVLDLSSFNTSKVTNMLGMFSDCSNLTTIYAGDGWSMATVSVNSNMFTNCTRLVGGKGTTYDPNHTNGYYAHIDGGPSNPGYFTEKQAFLLGDVNGDGYVRINDVTALIDYLLSGDGSGINVDAADCNHDNDVRINDVTALIDYLLSGSW